MEYINIYNKKYKNLVDVNKHSFNNRDFSSDEKLLHLKKEKLNNNHFNIGESIRYTILNNRVEEKNENINKDNRTEFSKENHNYNLNNEIKNEKKNYSSNKIEKHNLREINNININIKNEENDKLNIDINNLNKKENNDDYYKSKFLKKIPSKSKMNINKYILSKHNNNFIKNKINNKKIIFNNNKKFNNEEFFLFMKNPINKNIFKNKKNIIKKKSYEDEIENKLNMLNNIEKDSCNIDQFNFIKESINRVNITNNMYNNKNILLDISATYDPDLDSRGETSVDRSKSRANFRRSYSINDNNKIGISNSPKENRNKLISINENYKEEVNESFNLKIIKLNQEEDNNNKYNKINDNVKSNKIVKSINHSNEIVSSMRENLKHEGEIKNSFVISTFF